MHKLLTPITRTDSYKASHFLQYPEGATRVSSYIEARGGAFDEVVFFGLQAFIKEYLMTPITPEDVEMSQALFEAHGEPFNYEGWMQIAGLPNGKLPIEIKALPEGTVTKPGIPQVQVVNTDPRFPWLTSYVETALLRAVWYPSTVATLSREAKKIIYQGLVLTAEEPDTEIPFKLHDFGARGATCSEAAMLGGMAHLINFMGTDTVEGLIGPMIYYHAEGPVGFSIPATEHSTVTSWGRDGELAMFKNLLEKHPTGLVACVSDSYDIFKATRHYWGEELRDAVLGRDGTLVVRPDSGAPTSIPLDVIEILMEQFGYTVNSKGFRVLPPQVRVIQGDGMNIDTIRQLVMNAYDRGISVENFAMGMGGGLLQKVDRDTCKYAMKANAVEIGGEWRDVYKDPITDQGKVSKKGRQAVLLIDGKYVARKLDDIPTNMGHGIADQLRVVYRDGVLVAEDEFDDIRVRAAL